MLSIDISNIEEQELLDYLEKNIEAFSDIELSITFNAEYSQARLIRILINFIFEKNGIDSLWRNRFSLIGDELINNSIEYGSLPLDKNTFTIHFKREGAKFYVNFQVQDTGKGNQAKTSAEMEEVRKKKEFDGFENYLGKRGRGLFKLITNMVDKLYFKDAPGGGLIVCIEKTLG